jgi:predicted amidohydrolase
MHVGLIQTSLDSGEAWVGSATMAREEEERAVSEIRRHMTAFRQESVRPDIVLLPELAVPRGFEPRLRKMARTLEAIVIAGLDYRMVASGNPSVVVNEAVVIVPGTWRGERVSARTSVRYVGKTYPAPEERRKLADLVPRHEFMAMPEVWLFDGGRIGRFGVAICYDFMDLDRLAMYREQVQHFFVLAYNKDIKSFDHAAEAMARMVFCNVVICNCGHFGGSVAVSPYRRPERRTVYRHSGAGLATSQIISLPVASLHEHQAGQTPSNTPERERFKSLPPGYSAPAVPVRETVDA